MSSYAWSAIQTAVRSASETSASRSGKRMSAILAHLPLNDQGALEGEREAKSRLSDAACTTERFPSRCSPAPAVCRRLATSRSKSNGTVSADRLDRRAAARPLRDRLGDSVPGNAAQRPSRRSRPRMLSWPRDSAKGAEPERALDELIIRYPPVP
jgi:hypothetical protein